MQDCCCIVVNGLTIRVLRQPTRDGCRLRLRDTGRDGEPLDDEGTYLAEHKEKLQALLGGHTIRL